MKIQKSGVLLVLAAAILANTVAQTVGRRAISSIPTGKKYIALTFDDGPNTTETIQILDELKRLDTNAKVTFYVNGSKVTEDSRPVLQRTVAEGHDVDNHGYFHYSHGAMHLDSKDENGETVILETKEKASENLKQNSQLIYDETGYWPFSFRAPFFEWGDWLVGLDKELNMPFVRTWYDTNDWSQNNQQNPEAMATALLGSNKIVSGAIILMHDAPEGTRQGTVASLKHFVPQLIEQGFVFVTVRELFVMKQRQPEVFKGTSATWNPNAAVPVKPDQDKTRYGHENLWPDNLDNWWSQDWWTCSTPPWARDLSQSCEGGSTGLSGTIDGTNNHWGTGGNVPNPVIIDADITIPEGTTVTIEPGTNITIANGGKIVVNGIMNAVGTLDGKINFSSSNTWHSIECNGTVNVEFVKMNNVSSPFATTSESILTVKNSIIQSTDQMAILESGDVTFSNSVLISNAGVFSWTAVMAPQIRNNIIEGTIAFSGMNIGTTDGIKYNLITASDNAFVDCVEGYSENILDKDPLFTDASSGDYHLQTTSPAIDAGDPADDFSNEPNGGGDRINIGAYGNTSEATKAIATAILSGSNGATLNQISVINSELHFENTNSYAVEIFSVNGQLLKEISGTETAVSLNSLGLANGIYQMRVVQGVNVYTGQFILK